MGLDIKSSRPAFQRGAGAGISLQITPGVQCRGVRAPGAGFELGGGTARLPLHELLIPARPQAGGAPQAPHPFPALCLWARGRWAWAPPRGLYEPACVQCVLGRRD